MKYSHFEFGFCFNIFSFVSFSFFSERDAIDILFPFFYSKIDIASPKPELPPNIIMWEFSYGIFFLLKYRYVYR